MRKLIGAAMLFLGAAGFALATPVPEIDAATSVSAIALLAGGLVVLRGRRRK